MQSTLGVRAYCNPFAMQAPSPDHAATNVAVKSSRQNELKLLCVLLSSPVDADSRSQSTFSLIIVDSLGGNYRQMLDLLW